MKPITTTELNNLKKAKQYFQDCYLVSSVSALAQSNKGQKILSENIAHTDSGFKIRFNNINGKSKDFFVTQKEMDDLIYLDRFKNPIPIPAEYPHNHIIKAIEVAMNKLLEKFPSKKPWICRFPNCNEKFEFNKPSNFLEMFTGIRPLELNESKINLNLKSKAKESRELFNKISEDKNSSFVAGTTFGLHKGLTSNHCYSVTKIDKEKEKIELFDHRFLETLTLSYDEAIKKLKFFVGYFEKDLK